MHITIGKLLLILIDFVELWTHVSVCTSSTDLATKDVSTLSCGSWLSVSSDWVRSMDISLFDFSNHLHLISVVHDKLFTIYRISPVYWTHSSLAPPRSTLISWPLKHDLALWWYCRYLVVIFLNWRQIYISSIYNI